MDAPIIPVLSALVGSLIGGSATVATAWVTQRTVNKRELVQIEVAKREALYGEFIAECSRLLVDALTHTLDDPEKLLPSYALVNRIRLSAPPPVLAEAERLLKRITDQYFSKNLSLDVVRDMVLSKEADPLYAFSEACRTELRAMREGL